MPLLHRNRTWLVAAAGTMGTLALAFACTTSNLADTGSTGGNPTYDAHVVCGPGKAGCPCNAPGQTIACGQEINRNGDYVTCSQGTSTCQGGAWGACVGGTTFTKSLVGYSLGSAGIHREKTLPCPLYDAGPPDGGNECDPNQCPPAPEGPGDVDAAGVLAREGGVSIAPSYDAGDGQVCTGLECQIDWGCPAAAPTTLTGTVYDPAGAHPLYNAYVYVPIDPMGNLPPFATGAACDSCATVSNLSAVAVAQTDVTGKFTLTNVPTTDLAPKSQIPLVVQMGKWRRMVMLPAVPDCATTTVAPANSRLPRNKFDGANNTADIPKMALATGNVDPMECLMLKMGLDPAEFQVPGGAGNRRVDLYVANGLDLAPGNTYQPCRKCPAGSTGDVPDCCGGTPLAPSYTNLVGSQATINGYDAVILPCEGFEDSRGNNANAGNVASYAMSGGRLFTTHFGYTWLATPTGGTANQTNPATGQPNPFYAVANWNLNHYSYGSAPAQIDTTLASGAPFPKGLAFEQWMDNLGAASAGKLTLDSPRHDVESVNPAYATEWMHHIPDTTDGGMNSSETFHFTFDTPLGAGIGDGGAPVCGRAVYSDFHVTTAALVSGSCRSDSDCGFGSTCMGGSPGTCSAQPCSVSSDCADKKFTCAGTPGKCDCFTDGDCAAMGAGTCQGTAAATCGCSSDAECASINAGSCHFSFAGSCSVQTCSQDSDCHAGTTCTGASATQKGVCGCFSDFDCPSGGGVCQGGAGGACFTPTCFSNSQCPSGYCIGSGSTGECTTATCSSNASCTQGPGNCAGNQPAACIPNACTTNADCNGELCTGGTCRGCNSDNNCPGTSTCQGGTIGTCSGTPTAFPNACAQAQLTAQETALEFMLLDLTACVSPDNVPPPPPQPPTKYYYPVTFTEDFTASCPTTGTHVIWRELDWQATVPDTASIVFSAQTTEPPPDGGAPDYSMVQSVPVATATATTPNLPAGISAVILDVRDDAGMPGAFNVAKPPVTSQSDLRLTITLNPTSDHLVSPTLIDWKLSFDCVPSE